MVVTDAPFFFKLAHPHLKGEKFHEIPEYLFLNPRVRCSWHTRLSMPVAQVLVMRGGPLLSRGICFVISNMAGFNATISAPHMVRPRCVSSKGGL